VILRDLSFQYGPRPVLSGVALDLSGPGLITLAGPNGAGKSTLLAVLAGLLRSYQGSCQYRGREVRQWPRREFASKVSFVPQSFRLEFPFTAEEVVLMGRTPHSAGMFDTERDFVEVRRAMELTDTTEFRARDFRSLSGGERQRVVLASALAQRPDVLLLDEPTTFLDLEHQVAIYRLLSTLAREGLAVIAATHDLNLASAYGNRVILLAGGHVQADGDPQTVVTRDNLRRVFRVDAEIHAGRNGIPWVHVG
jgi:iron complex transport system ATP-binding protein